MSFTEFFFVCLFTAILFFKGPGYYLSVFVWMNVMEREVIEELYFCEVGSFQSPCRDVVNSRI